MQQHALLLGRNGSGYLKLPGTEHACLYARTGSGKTTSMIVPNCFKWPGSMIVLDIKGECYKATAGHRYSRLEQDVYLFDPAADTGRTHRWNPLSFIDRTAENRFDQITRQAYTLFPESTSDHRSQGSQRFWDDAARQAFVTITSMIAETPGEQFTMGHIYDLFIRGDFQDWTRSRIDQSRSSGHPYSQSIVSGVSSILSANHELVENIRYSVSTRLQPWFSPSVVAATDASDFNLTELRRKPTSIYVVVSPGHLPRIRPLLRLFFDQVINLNTDTTPAQDPSLNTPMLIVLDEFARLDRLPILAEASQFVRGYGIRMLYSVQNKAQVVALYGQHGAADLFDNLGVEIVFGTGDIELAAEWEKRMGDDTLLFDTKNKPRFLSWLHPSKQTQSQHPHRRPVMLKHEIVQMQPHQQLLIRPGMRPMKSERIIWYKDKNFRDLECTPPDVPELAIQIKEDDRSVTLPARPVRRT